ncbi:MAG: aminoacyl-histidine dipeptidase [Saprospiraceae bacterium]
MNSQIRALSPIKIWNYFADINAIPRPSKHEERISSYMLAFGENLGLESHIDDVGNIIIKKPATKGMESAPTVILQSHLDMVHQKNSDTDFDFGSQGIEMVIDEEWVRAKGTTLGADNGIGVAAIMAILASNDIAHPSLEALFTIDEETGMTGAKSLNGDWFEGKILLNLDTEEDDEIDIGCAGGLDVTAEKNYTEVDLVTNGKIVEISIKGLIGGHSGIDIDKGRANANKLLARIVFDAIQFDGVNIISMEGGSLRNAIPRESHAILHIQNDVFGACNTALTTLIQDIKTEFSLIEPNLSISLTMSLTSSKKMVSKKDGIDIVNTIFAAHNGVFRMSPDVADLVEASNNVAKINVKEGKASILCLTRSSVESTKWLVAKNLEAVFQLGGFDVSFSGDYPGWAPNKNSQILQVLVESYKTLFKSEPKVVACHAGLECGIIGSKVHGLDMISFGPTIKGAHSPDEKVNIASVQKFWDLLLFVLRKM